MFKSYIDYKQFNTFFPEARKFADNTVIESTLNNAAFIVSTDLRKKDIDVSRTYLPLMFDSDVRNNPITKSDYTSDSISPKNEKRLVVDITSTTGCTFYLEGSNDDIYWNNFEGQEGQFSLPITDAGRTTVLLNDFYKHVRYRIVGTATYSIFLVDTAFDTLLLYRTLSMIASSKLGYDGNAEVTFEQAMDIYNNMINKIKFDYDRDDDGTIDSEDIDVVRKYTIAR